MLTDVSGVGACSQAQHATSVRKLPFQNMRATSEYNDSRQTATPDGALPFFVEMVVASQM
jgi:hypothetical protein